MTINSSSPAALAQPHPISQQLPKTQQDWTQFSTTLNQWLQYLAPQADSFVATMTGGTTAPSVTIEWERSGNVVTALIPGVTVTSNATTCALGSVPANLIPAKAQTMAVPTLMNNGTAGIGGLVLGTSGALSLFVNLSSGNFASSGTKGISSPVCVTWLLT